VESLQELCNPASAPSVGSSGGLGESFLKESGPESFLKESGPESFVVFEEGFSLEENHREPSKCPIEGWYFLRLTSCVKSFFFNRKRDEMRRDCCERYCSWAA
jgi:hypothetical protein